MISITEAVAETLVFDILASLAGQLADDRDGDEVELVLCRVALTSELVAAGLSSWLSADWVTGLQRRAVDWYLSIARHSLAPQAEGLERWLLAIGPSLARLPPFEGSDRLDVLV